MKPSAASDGEQLHARGRPSALFLTPEPPYLLQGGGGYRSASLLEYIGRRYDVDVVAFRQRDEPDPAVTIPAGLARRILVLDLPYHSRRVVVRGARTIRRLIQDVPPLNDRFSGFGEAIQTFLRGRRYDLAIVEHFWCAPYWEQLAPCCRKVVLDLHNVESVLLGREADVEAFPAALALRRFQTACKKLEGRWLQKFDVLLTASETDAGIVLGIAPESDICVYPNSLPFFESPLVPEEHMVAFSGNFGYAPNIDAVRHFRKRIWPLLRRRWPQLVWRLIGKNPEAVSRYILGDPSIQTTGPVANALDLIASAQVTVVPVRAASGTRVKVLEAWAASRPVVSTSVGVEGLPAHHGSTVLLADGPEEFADAVGCLIESKEQRERMGRLGRRLYETGFTWEASWAKLAAAGI